MRTLHSRVFVVMIAIYISVMAQCTKAATNADPCTLSSDLSKVVAKEHPERRVLSIRDLSDYDKKLYREDHGTRCPGVARVNFYGDKRSAVALVLIGGTDPKSKALLVVARHLETGWELRILDSADENGVVWRQHAGKYEDVYGQESLVAAHAVIVFCGYGSWAILYAWTDNEVKKLWLSD